MLAITMDSAQAEEVADFGIPFVVINRTVNFDGISQVGSDNYSGVIGQVTTFPPLVIAVLPIWQGCQTLPPTSSGKPAF